MKAFLVFVYLCILALAGAYLLVLAENSPHSEGSFAYVASFLLLVLAAGLAVHHYIDCPDRN